MIETLKERLPDYAKDLKLNLSTVLSEESESALALSQIQGIALACAYATKNPAIILHFTSATETLGPAVQQAAKAAASIMAMNNVYYRFVHLVSDSNYKTLPARLRMNVMANPGIEQTDFELYCLAVSAINGCGLCMDSHVATLVKQGLSKGSIQHAVRIAAVINAVAQVLAIEQA